MFHDRRGGFALVVVLLVSVVALLAFLFASATLTIASRSSVVQERGSTQALLAADAGLRTLIARAANTPFTGATLGDFKGYIESDIGMLDLGGGTSATLVASIDDTHEDGPRLIVQSTGQADGSTRVLVQEFEVALGPPIPARVSVPGALTSVGTIRNASNAARVYGYSDAESGWFSTNVPACTVREGEYVRLNANGPLYRVVDGQLGDDEAFFDCADTASIQFVNVNDPNDTQSRGPADNVAEHMPIATSGTMTANADGTHSIDVTDAAIALFGEGSTIRIGDAVGEVTSSVGNTLTIEWEDDPPSPAEGTVIRRSVSSGVTAGSCNIRQAAFPQGCEPGANLDNLFARTFGIANPQLLKDSLSASQKISNSQLRDGRVLSGITWLSDPENNTRGQTGTGILIIETNPGQTINLNVHNNFTGLIYVIGDADIQGNSEHLGAIVVDGVASVDTSVQGGGDKVRFDPLALARALAGITFPNPELGGLGDAIANTWRVQ